MSAANPSERDTKPVNLRVPRQPLSIIDRAAAMLGRSRTEFMIEASRRAAEDAILDQSVISVDPEKYQAFVEMLDRPAQPNDRLRAMMERTPLWEKQ